MQHTALDGDEGRQADRTSLSWFRTAVGFAAVVALAIRQAPSGAGRAAAFGLGALTVAAVVALAGSRSRRLRDPMTSAAPAAMLATLSTAVVLVNVLAIVLFH